MDKDKRWMEHALRLAREAANQVDVPIGAVVVKAGVCIAEAANASCRLNDPTAHAEVLALRQAAQTLGNYRLTDCTLYVTLEPCLMCVGALIHARIKRVVFGAYDPKVSSLSTVVPPLLANASLNHRLEFTGGVLQRPCQQLLQDFFSSKRNKSRKNP